MPVIELHNRYRKLVDLRSNWESHWQEIADYVLPRRADVIKDRSRGDKRTEQIYDGTALHALNLLSSSLHGMLTNAATPWFSLRFKQEQLATDENMEWLESANQAMYIAFDRSNFQQEVHLVLLVCILKMILTIFYDLQQDTLKKFIFRKILKAELIQYSAAARWLQEILCKCLARKMFLQE